MVDSISTAAQIAANAAAALVKLDAEMTPLHATTDQLQAEKQDLQAEFKISLWFDSINRQRREKCVSREQLAKLCVSWTPVCYWAIKRLSKHTNACAKQA